MPAAVRLFSRLVPAVLLAGLVAWPAAAPAQQRLLTLDDIYHPDRRVNFSGSVPARLRWISDTHYVWPRADGSGGVELVRVEADTGVEEPLFDGSRAEAALAGLPGVSADAARQAVRRRDLVVNREGTALVAAIAGDLYFHQVGTDTALRLTASPSVEEEVSISPDGTMVAFVRSHDLFVVDVSTGRERALTTDGSEHVLNGKLDWVYQEELYGRGNFRGYWWSPDSRRIAYLRLDQRDVPRFPVVDHIPYHSDVEQMFYPKAGDPNATVRIGVVGAAGGDTAWLETTKYDPIDFLIVNVTWSPDSADVIHQVQDREQTWLDLNSASVEDATVRTLFRETTGAWVNRSPNPYWLRDGSFLWISERSGWKHLYQYGTDGTLVRQVTDGRWEARVLHGVDEADGWIYFSGTERSHIGLDVYRIRLDGSDLTRLSQAAGTHSATFSPSALRYIDTWSDVGTPPQVRLHGADGAEIRTIDENRVSALADFRLSTPEFIQVETRDGFPMEAMVIRPPDFDPSRTYPVYQHTYAGPHAQQVRNAWAGQTYLFHQLLAQHGIVVWMCDNRTASGKGAESTWPVYQNFGELELRDIEDGVAWLKEQPWVDPSRIGINGWSYGGYMVSYALTHSQSFSMGIAGGSVTDWRDYDTIYTERYMRMPQNNPDGYRRSSPRFFAENLHGRLLLIHGTMDDNVHMQNTLQFAWELQKSGKRFDLMLYPRTQHGVTDPQLVWHLRTTMLGFILDTLKPSARSS